MLFKFRNPLKKKLLFQDIEGYEDLKKVIGKLLSAKDSAHGLLIGQPASGKTLFLLSIKEVKRNVLFIDATNASGAGMVDMLFRFPRTKILLIDEIEKMSRKDQASLLHLMETGDLISTKVKSTKTMHFDGIKVFATANDPSRITAALASRFISFTLPEYTEEQFRDIVRGLLKSKFKRVFEVSDKITDYVYHELGSQDVRDAIQIGRICGTIDEVDEFCETYSKYNRSV